MKQQLPLGNSGFISLRDSNQIYIDKTDLIYTLACQRRRIFLSRPRRFGKSLLVSTFETLFKDGLKWFDGLQIANLWNDKQYKVITLDLSSIKENSTIESMTVAFESSLLLAFTKVGFTYKENKISLIDQIKGWLLEQEPNSLVLLVDEYDAPLNSHLHQSEFFEQIRAMLSQFFLMVKSTDMVWRFIFLTGIAKFNKASIFSAFNNLTDISLSPKYSTLLGYTEEEILHSFDEYVEQAAKITNMTVPQLMDAMREKYDGFCFDEKASTHVYAPWSVLSFLNEPERGLQNFWYGSAGNSSMMQNYLANHQLTKTTDGFGEEIPVAMDSLKDSNDSKTLSIPVFLYQAGYLTIKRVDEDFAYLNFPNGEVIHAMNKLMSAQMQQSKEIVDVPYPKWRLALNSANLDDFVQALNTTFIQIDYLCYPLHNESDVRAAVQIYLLGGNQLVEIERHNAKGRSDMEFLAKDVYWILEFKYARLGDNPETLLAEALRQMQNNQYGRIPDNAKKIVRAVLIFDSEKKQFTKYRICPTTACR